MDTGQVVRKALADPTRLRIYEAIASQPEYYGEIIERQGLSPLVLHPAERRREKEVLVRARPLRLAAAPTTSRQDDLE
jgi:hypothetical protein